jgi:glucosyl-3-phosphoglycerate synthase
MARGGIDVIITHDCDILNYRKEFLARLAYPVASSSQAYEFCKAYYARVGRQLHGRVTRLFVTPLIRSLIRIVGHHPHLTYLDNFRYALSGEFAMTVELANAIRIPGDWGLEIGILAEVHRNTTTNRICQVDLTDNYEHKHQDLSGKDANRGLLPMAFDIAKSLFRTLAAEGVVLNRASFTALRSAYIRTAQDTLQRYHNDAVMNNLEFDQHGESVAIETFVDAIDQAAGVFLQQKFATPLIPRWSRVESAIPGFADGLLEAVEKDNKTS